MQKETFIPSDWLPSDIRQVPEPQTSHPEPKDDIELITQRIEASHTDITAAGFSSTTISALMGKDKSVVYNRVWRLKGRISASDSPQKEFFLSALEKK